MYAKRKCTVEPVIGIIKSVLGFRQFLLRGLENVHGEWNLVALAWNPEANARAGGVSLSLGPSAHSKKSPMHANRQVNLPGGAWRRSLSPTGY